MIDNRNGDEFCMGTDGVSKRGVSRIAYQMLLSVTKVLITKPTFRKIMYFSFFIEFESRPIINQIEKEGKRKGNNLYKE
jgi:hypothetical protein